MAAKQRINNAAAWLLHNYPYSESSLILDVFSREHGRLPLLARGARRPGSKLRGVLLAFQPLELTWFGSGEVRTLAGAEWLGGVPLLRGKSLLSGYYLNELLIKLLPREDAHPALFDAYASTVIGLARSDGAEAELRRFEIALLREIGYGMAFDRVAGSQDAVDVRRQYVCLIEKGIVDARGDESQPSISGKTLLDLTANDLSDPRTLLESKRLMRQIIGHYLGDQTLHSRRVFADLENRG